MLSARDLSRLFTRRRRRAPSGSVPLALAAGAGLMYLLDPDRGARRRALARDRGLHAGRRVQALAGKATRDLEYRLRGLYAKARSLRRHDRPDDEVVVQRVRAELGRVVSHPHAITVVVEEGCATVAGPVFREEKASLLARVAAVPGVRRVEDGLDAHDPEDHLPALQGGAPAMALRRGRAAGRWSPIVRVVAGALGVGLVVHGIRRKGQVGLATSTMGAALLLRDVQDRPLRRLLTSGVDLHKTVHIKAPVDEVYAIFGRPESFPRFMSHLREVRKLEDEGRYHWVAEGPLGVPVAWDAEVTERQEGRLIAWQSAPGAVVDNAGTVRFSREADGRTRLDIQMCYRPPLGLLGHLVATLFGADPKHAMDEDLVRLQSLLERGKTTAHHVPVRAEEVGVKR